MWNHEHYVDLEVCRTVQNSKWAIEAEVCFGRAEVWNHRTFFRVVLVVLVVLAHFTSFHIRFIWFMIHSDSFWFFTTSSASRGWAADSWIPPRLGLKPLRVTWRRNFLREEPLFFHTCGERKTEERQVHTHSMDIRDIRGHSTILHTSQDDVCTFVIPLCLCCPANLHPTFPWKRWLSAQCSVSSCRDTSLSNILWRDLQHHDIESIPNQVDEWINSWICVRYGGQYMVYIVVYIVYMYIFFYV